MKIVNVFQPVTIPVKDFIVDVWQGPKYVSMTNIDCTQGLKNGR